MKKAIVLVLLLAALAGGFLAVRWFRGDSEYEEALREFDEQYGPPETENMPAEA